MGIELNRLSQIVGYEDDDKEEENLNVNVSRDRLKEIIASPEQYKTPSQVAAEEVQPQEEKEKFSVKEAFSYLKAGFEGLGKKILGGAVGLAPDAIEQSTSLKPLAIENQIKTLEQGIKIVEKDLENGTQTKIKFFGGTEQIPMTVKEVENKRKELDKLYERLDRLKATKQERDERDTVSKRGRELALKGGEEAQEARQKVVEEYGEAPAWTGQWAANEVLYNTPQFISSFGLGLASGVITKNPKVGMALGFSSSFGLEASGAYEEAIRSGVDDDTAQRIGANTGVVNALIEQIPLGRMLNKDPVGKTIKKNVLNRITAFLIERAKDGAYEGITESMQEIVNNAFAMEYDENRELFDNIKESAFIGFVLGLIGGTAGDFTQGNGNINVIDKGAVERTNEAVEEAHATPPENRTPDQQELIESLVEEKVQEVTEEKKGDQEGVVQEKESPQELISRLAPESVPDYEVRDGVIVTESTAGNPAVLRTLPTSIWKDAKFETLTQDEYKAGDFEIDSPVEVTYKDGEYVLTDGANRVSQALANGDETIPAIVENDPSLQELATAQKKGKETKVTTQKEVEREISRGKIEQKIRDRAVKFREMHQESPRKDNVRPRRLANTLYADVILKDRFPKIAEISTRTADDPKIARILSRFDGLLSAISQADKDQDNAAILTRADSLISAYEQYKVVKSKERKEQIRKHLENQPDSAKFRLEQEEQLILDKDKNLTTKFLELPDIKGKNVLSKEFIRNLSNSKKVGLKAYEHKVIQDVLNRNFEGQTKINMADFRMSVMAQMMPLNIIETDTYANYGLSNIGAYSSDSKTLIFNSPFDHGNAGHFRQDFENTVDADNLEVREIPAQDGNPRARFAVVDTSERLTQDNIQQQVLTVSETRQGAEDWITNHTTDDEQQQRVYNRTKGLFAHARIFSADGETLFVSEIQSDAFQNGVGTDTRRRVLENKIKEYEQETIPDAKESLETRKKDLEGIKGLAKEYRNKANEELKKNGMTLQYQSYDATAEYYEAEISRYEEYLELAKSALTGDEAVLEGYKDELASLPKMTKEEKVFQTYRNIWHERVVRELVSYASRNGYKSIAFPTPRTVAVIEGFAGGEDGDIMPYEIESSDSTQELKVGDKIWYAGTEMTVVEADSWNVTAAASADLTDIDIDEFMQEEANVRWVDYIESPFEDLENDFGKIDTIKKVRNMLELDEVYQEYREFMRKEEDIKQEQKEFDDNTINTRKINDLKTYIANHEKLAGLVEDNIIEKEDINEENVRNHEFKDSLEEKYGLDHGQWNYILDAWIIVPNDAGYVEVKDQTLRELERVIKDAEEDMEIAENRERERRNKHNRRIERIEARLMPSDKRMKLLTPELKKDAVESKWKHDLIGEYELREYLQDAADTYSDEDSFSIDGAEDFWKEQYVNNYDMDIEGLWGTDKVWYYNDGRYGYENAYILNEGHAETFSQPDQYDHVEDVSEFSIDNYDSTQKTVLNFYDKQLNRYIKKFRKDNLRTVESGEMGAYEWLQSDLTETDNAPPTAYRIKEDMEELGIMITPEIEKEIIEFNENLFGDINVSIVEQIMYNTNALGAYKDRWITLANGKGNIKDTYLHEAYHKATDVFLTLDEQVDLIEEGMKRYGTDDIDQVDELNAENFIKYVKDKKSIGGRIRSIFKTLLERLNIYNSNRSKIEKFYDDIIEKAEIKEDLPKSEPPKAKIKKKAPQETKLQPRGYGAKRVSKLAVGVETKAMEANLTQGFQDIPEYRQINVQNQLNRAAKLLEEDPDTAIKIALGQEQPKYGLLPESVFTVVEEVALAEGMVDLLRQLATSTRTTEATAMGQRIRMLAERNPDSAVNKIREVVDARKKAIEKSKGYNLEKETKQIKKEVDKEVKKLGKDEWKSFIDSIEC